MKKGIKDKMQYSGEEIIGTGARTPEGKQGLWTYKNKKGEIQVKAYYKNDLRHGPYTTFHTNGKIAIESHYTEGQHSDTWKEYYKNGQIKEEGLYKEGKYCPINFWLENGKQILTKGTGRTIESFGASGAEIIEFHFLDGKFIKEVKLTEVRYGKFIPKDELTDEDRKLIKD